MLSKLSNVAIIVLCAVAVYAVFFMNKMPVAQAATPAYKVGDVVKDYKPIDATAQTFVIAVSPRCPHCQKMMPRLRELTNAAHVKNARVVAIAKTDSPEFRTFLSSNGVVVDTVTTSASSGLKIHNVPTVMVLNGQKVTAYQVGEFDQTGFDTIRKAF